MLLKKMKTKKGAMKETADRTTLQRTILHRREDAPRANMNPTLTRSTLKGRTKQEENKTNSEGFSSDDTG
jgi:hypothetical protein